MFLCVLGVSKLCMCVRGIEHFSVCEGYRTFLCVLGVSNVSLCLRGIERFSVC
jgi:hypothetical protein